MTGIFFYHSPTYTLIVSLTDSRSHDWPDWLASKLEDLPVSSSPLLLGLQMYAAMLGFLHE